MQRLGATQVTNTIIIITIDNLALYPGHIQSLITAVDCGSLASPKNGRVDLTGTSSGSTATYSCQSGFILVGSSTRTCQVNGLWSGQAPVCNGKHQH